MNNNIVQTFEESGLRFDMYSDGDTILNHESGFIQISSGLLKRLSDASRQAQKANPANAASKLMTTHSKLVRPLTDNEEFKNCWLADFKLEDTQIATYVYSTRTAARQGKSTDIIGENGRLA